MTSAVNWALLGLLIRQPGHGYQLTQRLERAYGAALTISSESHVYTALEGLARRGLIEAVGAAETGGKRQPQRYRASAEAVPAFAQWVRALGRRSSPLFARALTMLEASPALALEILDEYERECLRRLGGGPPASSGEGTAGDRIVAEERRVCMDARLPWIEFARGEIERRQRERGR